MTTLSSGSAKQGAGGTPSRLAALFRPRHWTIHVLVMVAFSFTSLALTYVQRTNPSMFSSTTGANSTEEMMLPQMEGRDADFAPPGSDGDVRVYDWPKNLPKEPRHLEPVRVHETLVPRPGYVTLDEAHRSGRVHKGAWIHLVDNSGGKSGTDPARLLLLKRKPNLDLCPKALTVVWRHTYRDEKPIDTVRRALVEELGIGDDVWDRTSAKLLTDLPIYYKWERDENRTDRQVTFLWQYELRNPNVTLRLDDEASEHKWVGINDLDKWVVKDAYSEGGPKVFCHVTISQLMRVALRPMKNTPWLPGPASWT